MLNVDTFYILAARGRRARACMQSTYFVLYSLGTNCKMRHLSRAISPVRSGNPVLTSPAWLHTQGATSWLSKSEFPGFLGYASQILYFTVVISVPRYRHQRRISKISFLGWFGLKIIFCLPSITVNSKTNLNDAPARSVKSYAYILCLKYCIVNTHGNKFTPNYRGQNLGFHIPY